MTPKEIIKSYINWLRRGHAEKTEPVEPGPFMIPWGSESICFWCLKIGKCEIWTENKSILLELHGVPARALFKDIYQKAQIISCEIDGFEANYSCLPSTFVGRSIVERYR